LHNFHYLAVKKEGVAKERLAKFKQFEKKSEEARNKKQNTQNNNSKQKK